MADRWIWKAEAYNEG